jgi:hypothetical protein
MFTNISSGSSIRGTLEGELEVEKHFKLLCKETNSPKFHEFYKLYTCLACLRSWTKQTGQPFQEQEQMKLLSKDGNQATQRRPR